MEDTSDSAPSNIPELTLLAAVREQWKVLTRELREEDQVKAIPSPFPPSTIQHHQCSV